MAEMVDCAILAGGKPKPDDQGRIVTPDDEIGGRPMAHWVIDAIRGCKYVDKIGLVGLREHQVPPGDYCYADASEDFLGNFTAGIRVCDNHDLVLFAPADTPFVTPEALDDFVGRAIESGGQLCYPAVTIESCKKEFPDLRRTTIKIGDGEFTSGNFVVASRSMMEANKHVIASAFDARKSPVAIAKVFGFSFVLKFLFAPKSLSLRALEELASRKLKTKAVVIRTEYASLATDVDKYTELEIARKYFDKRDVAQAGE
jgi:GTP:adenosylcobinamide-phosphate guanylyltransferase